MFQQLSRLNPDTILGLMAKFRADPFAQKVDLGVGVFRDLSGNTPILVCSDNGPEPGAGSAGSFRGVKGTLYEGGIRSPLIVWGPGLRADGTGGRPNETSVFCDVPSAT